MLESERKLTRRRFTTAAAATAAVGLALPSTASSQNGRAGTLRAELLFELDAELESPHVLDDTPYGSRRIYVATGGKFWGPKLSGTVIGGSGDWGLVRADGVFELDVRATLRTDDGEIIYATYGGVHHRPDDGGPLYFRTTPRFETGAERYAWLNRIVAVGIGLDDEDPKKVSYTVYRIL